MFFSADVGKNNWLCTDNSPFTDCIDCVLTTLPLQTVLIVYWQLTLYRLYWLCTDNSPFTDCIDCVLTTHPLQTVLIVYWQLTLYRLYWLCTDNSPFTDCNQTQFCCQCHGRESFCVHCFACWTSPEMILFSGSFQFHLLQDPGYRVWSLASRTKCSVSANTWCWRLYFLPVLGKYYT